MSNKIKIDLDLNGINGLIVNDELLYEKYIIIIKNINIIKKIILCFSSFSFFFFYFIIIFNLIKNIIKFIYLKLLEK